MIRSNIMKNIFIYLSGSIKKSHNQRDETDCWTEQNIQILKDLFLVKALNVVFLNPASRSDDLSDELSLFGRDTLQVLLSDVVLADMRNRRGIGVGYEVAFANFKAIPVVSWAPTDSHYRPLKMDVLGQSLTNGTHPFVSQTSKNVADTLEEAVDIISAFNISSKIPLAVEDYPSNAIKHYLTTQLDRDTEMKSMIHEYKELAEQVHIIKYKSQSSPREPGAWKGKVKIAEDFDILPDSIPSPKVH